MMLVGKKENEMKGKKWGRKKEGDEGKLFFLHCVCYEWWKIERKNEIKGKVINKTINLS